MAQGDTKPVGESDSGQAGNGEGGGFRFAGLQRDKTVEGDFEVEGQKLHVVFFANRMTPAKVQEMHDEVYDYFEEEYKDKRFNTGLENEVIQAHAAAKMLALSIKEWDATDAQPTFDFLKQQPLSFLLDLALFGKELINPDPKGKRRRG